MSSAKKRAIVTFFILVLVLSVAVSYGKEYTSKKRPKIVANFGEWVTVTEATLTDIINHRTIELSEKASGDRKTYNYTPASDLAESDYMFNISANDAYGNPMENNTESFEFTADFTSPIILNTYPLEGAYFVDPAIPFSVEFSEPVIIESIDITNEANKTDSFTSQDQETWGASITISSDGIKIWSIKAKDYAGNHVEKQVTFTMDAYPIQIGLVVPRLGVASAQSINLTVSTDERAKCSFSNLGFGYMAPMNYTANMTHHYRESYTISGSGTRVYIQCNSTSKWEVVNQTFDLTLDTTAPVIESAAASPDTITELPYETDIIVSTNEKAVCRYTNISNATDFYSMLPFSDYDEEHTEGYKTSNTVRISNLNEGTYTYYVKCMNLAQLFSDRKTVTFSVEIPDTPDFAINSPSGIYNTTSVPFNVTSNMNSLCYYGDTADTPNQLGTGTPSKMHYQLVTFSRDGSYSYFIRCVFSASDLLKQTTFSIDTTAPTTPVVNDSSNIAGIDPEYTYYTNKLYGSWKSQDNETGISEYEYRIYEETTEAPMTDWEQTADDREWVTGLELEDGVTYYFRVKARNGAGKWSSEGVSDGVTVDTGLANSSCNDSFKGQGETDVDCGGECGPCEDGKTCRIDSDCENDNCVDGECKSSSCTDGIQNGGETDVDCGGPSCSKCGSGKECEADTDCSSSECDSILGSCSAGDPCTNKQKDAGEADVDCGGACERKCGSGKRCNYGADCNTGTCTNGLCTTSGGDSDSDGMPDSWETANGLNPNDASDAAKDADGDGYTNLEEYNNGTDPRIKDAPANADTDGDGMPDAWEQSHGLNPNLNDASEDPDAEGLVNIDEYNVKNTWSMSTDPLVEDTDGDGYTDKEEMDGGTDPTDSNSKPAGGSFLSVLLVIIILIVVAAGGYLAYATFIKKKPKSPLGGSGGFGKNPFYEPMGPFGERAPPRSPMGMPGGRTPAREGSQPTKPALGRASNAPGSTPHQVFEQRSAEKSKEREKVFTPFGKPGESPGTMKVTRIVPPAGAGAKPQEAGKGQSWVPLGDLKKTEQSGKKTSSDEDEDIFNELSAIGRKRTPRPASRAQPQKRKQPSRAAPKAAKPKKGAKKK